MYSTIAGQHQDGGGEQDGSQLAAGGSHRRSASRFAKKHGCIFAETSARHNLAVEQAFEELVIKMLDTPSLVSGGGGKAKGVGIGWRRAHRPAEAELVLLTD